MVRNVRLNLHLELASFYKHGICDAVRGKWQMLSADPGCDQDPLHCVDVKIVVVDITGQLENKLEAHKIACCSTHSV